VEEVRVGYEILQGAGIRQHGPDIIACPTCGRCGIDLFQYVEQVEKALLTRTTPVKLAIMGCVVNGPGEAREADIGIAGGKGRHFVQERESGAEGARRANGSSASRRLDAWTSGSLSSEDQKTIGCCSVPTTQLIIKD
jgi:4-hydroxy-3-methylbut-2-en-1-yl diphosphate synthase IspG/GcpE